MREKEEAKNRSLERYGEELKEYRRQRALEKDVTHSAMQNRVEQAAAASSIPPVSPLPNPAPTRAFLAPVGQALVQSSLVVHL